MKSQVTARRIIAGKWACNSGQACISVDHIITRKDFAPKLVRLPLYYKIHCAVTVYYSDMLSLNR